MGRRFRKMWSGVKGWARRWRGGNSGGNQGGDTVDLTEAEQKDLLFMREEEKMARDVYITLGEEHGHNIFYNISSSEQRHMDAILNMLNKYGLQDPAANTEIGEFKNAEIQALYKKLVLEGTTSLLSALNVGALIEETDIEDINAAISRTDKSDITRVYSNLLNGSHNHLRAFVKQIESITGQAYVAKVISAGELELILAS